MPLREAFVPHYHFSWKPLVPHRMAFVLVSDQTQLLVEAPAISYFPIPTDGKVFWSGFTFYWQLVSFGLVTPEDYAGSW